jgi:hypothetical protein
MPKILTARPPLDATEEAKIRKLARARHAPADWIARAKILTASWQGLRVPVIADRLGCHEYKVRRWLHRFNTSGLDGLGTRPGCGRKPRITRALPPDRRGPIRSPGTAVARRVGAVAPRGGRRSARVDLGHAHRSRPTGGHRHPPLPGADDPAGRAGALAAPPWATSTDPEFVSKARRSSSWTPIRRRTPR